MLEIIKHRILKSPKSFLLRHELLILLICIVTILRIPSLFEPYWYGDEGIYLTLGQGVRHGEQLYRDIHDNKPPVIYLLAALAGSQFWFRFLLLIWNVATITVFSRFATLWLETKQQKKTFHFLGIEFPSPITPAAIATILFAFLPFFAEGNIANGEIFMILPTLIGMTFLTKQWKQAKQIDKRTQWIYFALAGFAFSIAFLTKVPALFDAIAAGLFFFLFIPFATSVHATVKDRILHTVRIFLSPGLWIFSAAFLLPILATVGYYASIGAGEQYIRGAFAQNIGYLSSWKTGTHQAAKVGESGLKNRAIGLGIAIIALGAGSLVLSPASVFVGIWFACALFGALLSERPYPHYLVQLIPAFCLLVGITVAQLRLLHHRHSSHTRLSLLTGIVMSTAGIAMLITSLILIRFWYYPLTPYYKNFLTFATGKQTKQQYYAQFDPAVNDEYEAATLILERTTPNDRIFIWGDLPTLYALTRRIPPGRYTSAYHIQDFNGFEETLQAIDTHPPKLIIIDTTTSYQFAELSSILDFDYRLVDTIGRLQIYSRIPQAK